MWRTNENVHAFRNIHAMYIVHAFEYWQHDNQYEYYLNVLFFPCTKSMLTNAKE